MKILLASLSVAFLSAQVVAGEQCQQHTSPCPSQRSHQVVSHTSHQTTAPGDIVDIAASAGTFKTLVAAVQAAELVDTLKGEGPFTVFAPTDEAFAALPEGTVEELLKPENKAKLQAVLTYHVVPGKVVAKDVVKLSGATTAQGQRVDIATTKDSVKVDGANIAKTDIHAANGVIHVVDRVLLPADKDLVATASSAESFKTLVAAAQAAGLVETLQGEGPFTIFAPTDDAFAKLPAGTVENLLKPENKDQLISILTYHVVPGRVYAGDIAKLSQADTVNGKPVTVAVNEHQVRINGATVVSTDIDATNGVIHVIDRVLLP
ncbi:MAG: fasciclin domain-containing protein [Bythopirellula sp.]